MENQKFNQNNAIVALKQQWRTRLKQVRQSLSLQRQEEASNKAYEILSVSLQETHYVLSFASFGTELNLWQLNQQLLIEKKLVLPRIIHNQMQLFCVDDINHLEKHKWGFLEPHPLHCKIIDPSLIDVALIPGLGFDLKNNHRLGYGQGYYDYFLSHIHFSAVWGIGFLEQAVENLPITPQDCALHRIYLF